MPFKSQAQRRKFAELVVEGRISNETYEEWTRETGTKKLPERVCKKPARQSSRDGATVAFQSRPPISSASHSS
jgi:hypothetical protein